MLIREVYRDFESRIKEKRQFIQCVAGPRQVGKSTMVTYILDKIDIHSDYQIADDSQSSVWISQLWDSARLKIKTQNLEQFIIAIDEIQKIKNWSEVVKKEWDYDTVNKIPIKLVILGSSRLLIQAGLSESLAGRFEMIQMMHWSFKEMNTGFGLTPEQYAWFGGYPGAAGLIKTEKRWKDYVGNGLIETTISKDILMMTRIDKPSLLKNLFGLTAAYSGQILSYNKMLGQLQDAGNTTTLAHYLNLLDTAGLSVGLKKIYKENHRSRSSSPKLQVYNNALISAQTQLSFKDAQTDRVYWGRIIESCIGTHLVNKSVVQGFEVLYWRHVNNEVDFVLRYKNEVVGIEVKSNVAKPTKGMEVFKKIFNPKKIYLIDNRMLSWQDFIQINPLDLF